MSFPIPRPRGKDMPSAKPVRETTNPRIDTVCQFMGHIEAAAEVKVPA